MITAARAPAVVDAALDRLSIAAADVDAGLIPSVWHSDGQEWQMSRGEFQFRQVGVFDALEIPAGEGLRLSTHLVAPSNLCGVDMRGETFELGLFSMRPIAVSFGGRSVFDDELPIVATGPALIALPSSAEDGTPQELVLDILPGDVRLDAGLFLALNVRLTTRRMRERFAVLDLAHARLLLASALAVNDAEWASVVGAASLVPDDILACSTEELRAALGDETRFAGMTAGLGWLDDRLTNTQVHCVGHSHIDLAWLHTYADAKQVFFRDMRTVVALAQEFPEFRFTHSQAVGYAAMEDDHPDLFAQVRALVGQGRLEPATAQWVEADPNLISGPSHARQLMEAVRYTQDHLGVRPKVMLAPDAFGHAGNLPQLARSAGVEVYYQHRANPGNMVDGHGWQAWEWEGDDGSRLLTVATPVYLGPVTATRIAQHVLDFGVANGIDDVCFFYGVGDHGGGPTREDLLAIRTLGAAPGFPAVRCSTVLDYAAALRSKPYRLPVAHGETDLLCEGCYTAHSDTKRLNRDSERVLVAADTLAAEAGLDVGAQMSEAWRLVLLHQFHDIICGSAVAEAYGDNVRDTRQAWSIATSVRDRALAVLTGGHNPDSHVVTNTVLAPWRGPVLVPASGSDPTECHVEDSDGQVCPAARTADGWVFVADLKPGESKDYRVIPGVAGDSGLRVDPDLIDIETAYLVAHIDPASGIVTSCRQKASGLPVSGREGLSPESEWTQQRRPDLGLAALHVIHEVPHAGSSWVSGPYDVETMLIQAADVTVRDESPVRVIVEARHRLAQFDAVATLSFYADLPWFEVDVETSWHETGSPDTGLNGLALSFGTRLPVRELWAETPFSAVARMPDGYLGPTLRWASLGGPTGGLAVANDSKHGVDALGPRLRYHLLRSAYDPDPASESGRVDVARFAVLPYVGSWKDANVVDWAAGFNSPPVVGRAGNQTEVAAVIRPRLEPGEGVHIAGMWSDCGGARFIRLYEGRGRRARVRLAGLDSITAVSECTITGDPISSPRRVAGGRYDLTMSPFDVRTLQIQ